MELRFCPLFSGSSGNSIYVEGNGTAVLVDAGVSGRAIENALHDLHVSPERLKGILVTHEHIDHIRSVGVLSRRYNIPVYANAPTWMAMQAKVGEIAPRNQRIFESDQDFYIRSLGITPFFTPHDAAQPVGYCLSCGQRRVAIATDLGCVAKSVVEALYGCDAVLLESNHDVDMLKQSSYPQRTKLRILGSRGHLCNEDAAKVIYKLVQNGVGTVMLGHLSAENNSERLAMETVSGMLQRGGVCTGEDVQLLMAHRDRVSQQLLIEG